MNEQQFKKHFPVLVVTKTRVILAKEKEEIPSDTAFVIIKVKANEHDKELAKRVFEAPMKIYDLNFQS